MDVEKLQEILNKHAKWLRNEVGGVRADLQGANLRFANLQFANLQFANLQEANLHGANLQNADLQDVDLRFANLQGANLQDAGLRNANLQGAALHGANLHGANLQEANLQGANVQEANLHAVNLSRANLQKADIRWSNLLHANLWDADLQDTRLNWVNWHEAKNIKVYVAGLQSSRENAQLTYIPSIDVATTGCWQGSWQATIERIHKAYADDTRERNAYDLAIKCMENQLALDNVTTATAERSQDDADWLVQKSDFISKDASTKAQ